MTEDILANLDDGYTVRVLKDMISIPSIVGEEQALAEYILEELKALGVACELHEVEPGRSNVYGCVTGAGPGKRLNLCGHTDTVPVVDGWDTDPFTPVEKDGRLYGLGACDMKAGLACALNVVRAFVRSVRAGTPLRERQGRPRPFRGELLFSGVVDEEAYSKGARAMLGSPYGQADAIVLGEPYAGDSDKPIPLGITGKMLYDVQVKGRAAHGFSPHLGINAIEEAAKILANLDRLDLKHHPDFGTGNTCTLKIEGGYSVYSVVVPALCRFEVNRLLVPGETVESAVQDMERLVAALNLSAEVEVGVKPPQYEAYTISASEPIIQVFDQVYREVMGVAPVYGYSNGITDANVFAGEAGIPCLHLGPERGGVHQKNEHVVLDWLPRVSRMYALIAARFLA